MTLPSLPADDPGCPEATEEQRNTEEGRSGAGPLVARRRNFDTFDPALWDSLVEQAPAATPFSRHCVQRAWWDAYAATAHDQTLEIVDPAAPDRVVAIAPFMHRHALEPGDVAARTALRHAPPPGTQVSGGATAVFFGASYHADYATLLAPPELLRPAADAVAVALASPETAPWDVVDLRRLRRGDPAADALVAALEAVAKRTGWCVTREREDVCPILEIAPGLDFEAYLGTLDKKERHEIRRKIRRAESAGQVRLEPSSDSEADLEAFIDLHQKRWAEEGLFPPTDGGAASRRFFAGLFGDCTRQGFVELSFLSVGDRRIAAGVTFDDGETIYYYNAGVDPEARELSPGVLMVACYIQRALAQGRHRLDFLRGDEPYKYAWGAVDEPIERILVEKPGEEDR